MPLLSILMPVFNAGPYLAAAIASVLSQQDLHLPFELLICDDGSTDGSAEQLDALAHSDPRIRLIHQPNTGIVHTLNRLVSLARGEYLARMDADDVMTPHRLARQVAFLDERPAIGVVGGWLERIGPSGERLGVVQYATDPGAVECGLLFRNTLAHPAVMIRREVFSSPPTATRYQPAARHVEDYALWISIAHRWGLANLPEVLLQYRVHGDSIGSRHAAYQQQASVGLQLAFLRERLGIEATPEQRRIHAALAFDRLQPTPEFSAAAIAWLRKLAAANNEKRAFPTDPFLRLLTGRYVAILRNARTSGLPLDPRPIPFAPYMHAGV